MGLHFLHENQTLHRDLKPGNILLTDNGAYSMQSIKTEDQSYPRL